MRDRAVVELDDGIARGAAEPGAPARDRESQRRSKPPRIERRTDPNHRFPPSAEPAQRVGDDLDLGARLRVVLERGEVASTASVGDVRAHRRDAVGGRLDDLHDRAPVGAVPRR